MKIALGHIEGSEEFHGLHLFLPHDSISTPSNWLPDEQPFSCPGFSLHRTRRVSPNRHQFYRDFDSGFSTGLTDTKKWNPYMSFNIVEYGLHHELSATCMPINQAGRTDHYKWTTSYLANLLLLYRSLKWSCSSPVNWGESRRNLFDKFHKPEVPQTRVLNILTILFAPTSISHPGSSIVRNLQNIPKQGKPRWTGGGRTSEGWCQFWNQCMTARVTRMIPHIKIYDTIVLHSEGEMRERRSPIAKARGA